MSPPHACVAHLVSKHLSLLLDLDISTGVLDLACGSGRNGLFVLRHKLPVTFADNNDSALEEVTKAIEGLESKCRATIWTVDFELLGKAPLNGKCFDAVLVFNYLHRPLFSAIRNAVRPGGLIFYETFTISQRKYGRPCNPEYLLNPGELKQCFDGWKILYYAEGEMSDPKRASASLIARKPH
ncbi:MAG: class I SAM-dependent methyltransferase [Gammaproteobacteria bacterium]|nr:class I SAM-dependent methyltransferase [Gammaproteobacteria bacterium]